MLKINTIDHLNVNIRNFEETVHFYQKHFGMSIKEEGVSGRGTPFKIIGLKDKIYLCLYEASESLLKSNNINHIGIHVDDFDATEKYIKDNKLKVTYDTINHGNSRSIYIEDPNGLEIELSEKFAGGLN